MSNYKKEDRLEKHYTTDDLIQELFKYLDEFYPYEITEFLENSAGDGRIVDFIKDKYKKDVVAYDIFNETKRYDIKECDYLKEKIEYKKGRVAIINPPFQKGLKFVYKALKECDCVITILSSTSILSIDYDSYDTGDIWLYKNYKFDNCKVSICIIGFKNKKN